MRVSPNGKLIATADTLGKIKLVEFPNIFNMLTVFLYNNEDIKFCDFVNNQNLIVINSKYEIHLWNLNDFKLKSKFDLKNLFDLKNYFNENYEKIQNSTINEDDRKDTELQENNNFCREDDVIKNVFYVKGKNIILQINKNINKINFTEKKSNFVVLEILENDDLILKNSDFLNEITMKDSTYLYIYEEKNIFSILEMNEEKNSLNSLSKKNMEIFN